MAGKSDYLENLILDYVLGNTDFAPSVYIELFTAPPNDAGTGGVVVADGDYARKTLANNPATFPAAVGGIKSNGIDIPFPPASVAWGTVVAAAVYDALTGGHLLYWTMLVNPITVPVGGTFSFATGQLKFTED